MADSLVLTGVKDVKKHTGTEMLLTRPKRGGDTHSLKEWWKTGGVSTCYVQCTVFDVTAGGATVKLALDTSVSTNVRIDHDGAFNFNFYGVNELKRAALFTEGMELIEHYAFPSISGGKVMTVTPADGASRPGGGGGGGGGATGVVSGASISDAGTGYTAGATGAAVSGGSGSGLTVDYTSDGDTVTGVTVASGGQDYVNGETVTITGGNNDAQLTITAS
jgi:hypothetical protein